VFECETTDKAKQATQQTSAGVNRLQMFVVLFICLLLSLFLLWLLFADVCVRSCLLFCLLMFVCGLLFDVLFAHALMVVRRCSFFRDQLSAV